MSRFGVITHICQILNRIFPPLVFDPQEVEKRMLMTDKDGLAELERMIEERREELSGRD